MKQSIKTAINNHIIKFSLVVWLFIAYSSTAATEEISSICPPLQDAYDAAKKVCIRNGEECLLLQIQKFSPGLTRRFPKHVSSNHYGYTGIQKISLHDRTGVALYLMRFNGDRARRTLETWLLPESQLKAVLEIPPGPADYIEPSTNRRFSDREINSEPFQEILKSGYKIADSHLPIYIWKSRDIAIAADFNLVPEYGGYHHTNGINSMQVFELNGHQPISTICMFE